MGGRALLLLAAWLAVQAAGAAPAPGGEELGDLESQADYAFYTGDARLATRLLAASGAYAEAADPRAGYQYAHAAFRRLQLATHDADRHAAGLAGEACLTALDAVIARAPRDAEAYALKAACGGYLALEGGLRARTLALHIDDWLQRAASLAPQNPRVLLVRGFVTWYRSDAPPERVARARVDFDAAAASLERPRGELAGEPSWGAPDAWLYAGRAAAAAGDLGAARSAYEHALLIAPEFGAARRALDGLAAGRGPAAADIIR